VLRAFPGALVRAGDHIDLEAHGRRKRSDMESATALPQEKEEQIVLIVGVDFSEASEYALTLAKNLVKPAGAHAILHLVHIASTPMFPAAFAGAPPSIEPTVDASLDWIKKRLEDMGAAKDTLAAIIPHVRFGDPANELAELARDLRADLVVVGGHKRGALLSALHRSMLARLVRRSPCSVLTALPKEPPVEAGIEPPCPDCLAIRRETSGTTLWCARHTGHHVHARLHYAAGDHFAVESWTFRA
jgi:nucleotide-binding universal stress UspA family protein